MVEKFWGVPLLSPTIMGEVKLLITLKQFKKKKKEGLELHAALTMIFELLYKMMITIITYLLLFPTLKSNGTKLYFLQGSDAFSQSGLYSNHQDIGPRYAVSYCYIVQFKIYQF